MKKLISTLFLIIIITGIANAETCHTQCYEYYGATHCQTKCTDISEGGY